MLAIGEVSAIYVLVVICFRLISRLISKVVSIILPVGNSITMLTIGEVFVICVSVVVGFRLISCLISKVRPIIFPVSHSISVSAVVLILSVSKESVLVVQVITFSVVLIKGKFVEFRNFVIKLLQVSLIGLLTNSLCIGVAITSCHSSRLTHSVHHCLLTLQGVLILILLIKSISVKVIGELLSVQNLVDGIINL